VTALYGSFGVLMCIYAAFLVGLTYRYRSRGDILPALGHGIIILGVGVVALAGTVAPDFRRTSLLIVGVLLIGDAVSRYVIARRNAS
jgi:hypothetical protein